MKHTKNRSRLLFINFISLLLCLGIGGNAVFGYPPALKQIKTVKYSGSQNIKSELADRHKIPLLPGFPYEEPKDQQEENNENGNNTIYFLAADYQIQFKPAECIPETEGIDFTENISEQHLPLYILFHSWKSFII